MLVNLKHVEVCTCVTFSSITAHYFIITTDFEDHVVYSGHFVKAELSKFNWPHVVGF